MLSLPVISPQDPHELWSTSNRRQNRHLLFSNLLAGWSDPNGSSRGNINTNNNNANGLTNGGGAAGGGSVNTNNQHGPSSRYWSSSSTAAFAAGGGGIAGTENLQLLQWEEANLRLRKKNIAMFGYSWIKPAGCPKTMMGMREEEAEREEGLAAEAAAATSADFGVIGGGGVAGQGADGGLPGQLMMGLGVGAEGDLTMERDLDGDIPDADALDNDEGLIEQGEEGFDGGDVNEELMERNLDDDIPEAYSSDRDDDDVFDDNDEEDDDDDDDGDVDFDQQPDLDDDIPAGDALIGRYVVRDLDYEIPDAAENTNLQDDEWQHTDTDAEDDDDDTDNRSINRSDPFAEHMQAHLRTSQHDHAQPSEAQRRFLHRWSGTTDVLESSGMMLDDNEEASHLSLAGQRQRISRSGRSSLRRGGPRDSLD